MLGSGRVLFLSVEGWWRRRARAGELGDSERLGICTGTRERGRGGRQISWKGGAEAPKVGEGRGRLCAWLLCCGVHSVCGVCHVVGAVACGLCTVSGICVVYVLCAILYCNILYAVQVVACVL
jgi:hypothetical protein